MTNKKFDNLGYVLDLAHGQDIGDQTPTNKAEESTSSTNPIKVRIDAKEKVARSQGIRVRNISAVKRPPHVALPPAPPPPPPQAPEKVIAREEVAAPKEPEIKKKEGSRWLEKVSRKRVATGLGASLIAAAAAIGLMGQIGPIGPIFGGGADSTEAVVREVGKLVELPEGEEPSIFTIVDLAPLSGQAFFAEAEVGDKVLIFGASKKAVLYRPSEKRIIAIGPVKE